MVVDEVSCCSVHGGVGDTALESLTAPRPLRPQRGLSGTSRVGSVSASGEALRRRPLVLVEVTILSLSLGFRPRRAG